MELIGLNVLLKFIKIPSCFAGGRGTSNEDGLEGAHTRRERMNDMHGDGLVIDVGGSVNDLFVDLVSKVHQHIQKICD